MLWFGWRSLWISCIENGVVCTNLACKARPLPTGHIILRRAILVQHDMKMISSCILTFSLLAQADRQVFLRRHNRAQQRRPNKRPKHPIAHREVIEAIRQEYCRNIYIIPSSTSYRTAPAIWGKMYQKILGISVGYVSQW